MWLLHANFGFPQAHRARSSINQGCLWHPPVICSMPGEFHACLIAGCTVLHETLHCMLGAGLAVRMAHMVQQPPRSTSPSRAVLLFLDCPCPLCTSPLIIQCSFCAAPAWHGVLSGNSAADRTQPSIHGLHPLSAGDDVELVICMADSGPAMVSFGSQSNSEA